MSLTHLTKELAVAVLFSFLSYLLGLIQFNIPGIDGGISNLSEIPLIISIFYIRRPFYIFILPVFLSLSTPADGSILSNYSMHLVGLVFCWYLYQFQQKSIISSFSIVVTWFFGVLAYYLVFLLPTMIVTNWWAGINTDMNFVRFYTSIVSSIKFEMLTSVLITCLFALQFHLQNELKANVIALEGKNKQLRDYAFLNSHLIRAPLTKILSITILLEAKLQKTEEKDLVKKLTYACSEFDEIIKLVAETLSQNDHLTSEELEKLSENVLDITRKKNDEAK